MLLARFDVEVWAWPERTSDALVGFSRGIVLVASERRLSLVRALLAGRACEEDSVQVIGISEIPGLRSGEGPCATFLSTDRLKHVLVQAASHIVEWVNRPLCVSAGNIVHLIAPSEIRYVESDRRVLHVHAATTIDTYATIGRLVELLPSSFVQCHKSYLVNLEYVSAFTGERIILVTGESVPVSQRRRIATREAIARFGRAL